MESKKIIDSYTEKAIQKATDEFEIEFARLVAIGTEIQTRFREVASENILEAKVTGDTITIILDTVTDMFQKRIKDLVVKYSTSLL